MMTGLPDKSKKTIFETMRWLTILLLLFVTVETSAQEDSVRRVQYTPEFRFNDGIYLNFSQVKNNAPIPAIRIVSNNDPFDHNFYKDLTQNKTIGFFDAFGAQQEVQTSQIWGYAQDGKLYVQYNGEFNRIPVIGRVCHFIADITIVNTYHDPYYHDYYNYGYYNPYSYRSGYPRTTRSKELRQYIIDFETGKVMSFDRSSVQAMLIEDPELYDEFMSLKKRKQNELLFFFIRRLNEKNPVYFPVR
jgi:hypothetical protein